MKLTFPKTIERWDEAVPLGNGICGALVWGTSEELRFSLDRGDIWDLTPCAGTDKKEFSYPTMVELARKGGIGEIRRIFDTPYNHALPSKLPAGKLIFDFGAGRNVGSALDLLRAEAEIVIGDDVRITSFLHAAQNIGMIRINQPSARFSFRIEHPQYGIWNGEPAEDKSAGALNTASLSELRYPAPKVFKDRDTMYFVQEISREFSYGVFAAIKEDENAVEIAYRVASSNDGRDFKKCALDELKRALRQGYENLLKSHMEWWERYFGKSSVTLPDAFFEKNWYLAQYLLASCSRKGGYPMPLQGVWTADADALPPWKGDYHFDLNVQMSYYSYLKANHLEEGEALIDYLWSMADCGRKFARSFYHSAGLCLPSTMTLTGEPLGGWGMYSLSPANQMWVCQIFERHYRFTGDRRFLEEKAYPYLRETAEFILGLLEEKEGKYYLPISSSPEVHDNTIEAFVTPNSNYDLSLMRYLFGALCRLSKELHNKEEDRWRRALHKLPGLSVNAKGVLRVSPDEELRESHRHFSHAMAIHPLRLLPYEGEENRRVIDATILDLERLGTGYWVGFSFAWMAELYAVQKNGNGAAHRLDVFWRQYCSPNGFHLNGDYKKCGTSTFHYRPFTLEGNFCAADALQEMLLQCEDGLLDLFPAVPDEWLEGTVAFENFRAQNGLLVSALMERGRVAVLTLKPQYSGKIALKREEKTALVTKGMEPQAGADSDRAEIFLRGGKQYVFGCKMDMK